MHKSYIRDFVFILAFINKVFNQTNFEFKTEWNPFQIVLTIKNSANGNK